MSLVFHRNTKNEIGNVYGRLTVLSRTESVSHPNGKHAAWLCKCKCGKTAIRRGAHLRKGSVRSCGCLALESQKRIGKMNQKYGTDSIRKYPIDIVKQRRTWLYNSEKYSISFEDLDNLFIRSNGKCEICDLTFENHKNGANVDHDHVTGKVRGILCQRCNSLLAGLEDKEFCMKATLYLKEKIGEVL